MDNVKNGLSTFVRAMQMIQMSADVLIRTNEMKEEIFTKLNDLVSSLEKLVGAKQEIQISETTRNDISKTIRNGISNGLSQALANAEAKVPTVEQMLPVMRQALTKLSPEIKYTRVISGRNWFWSGITTLVASVCVIIFILYNIITFDGTAESWANRLYVSYVERGLPDPGNGYHEIMKDFASGNSEKAKDKVIRSEQTMIELMGHREKYEAILMKACKKQALLNGLKIVDSEEIIQSRKEKLTIKDIWGNEIFDNVSYRHIYLQAILDDGTDLRIILIKRNRPFFFNDEWQLNLTYDKRICSVDSYLKLKHKVHWEHP